MELLGRDIEENPSLAEIADACRLSRSHFGRCFRKSFGVPAHQWLIQKRLARAKLLLDDQDLSLLDIALCCGFSDQSHFSRTFRRGTGTTPSRWRKLRKSTVGHTEPAPRLAILVAREPLRDR